jgi:hypothetical protein
MEFSDPPEMVRCSIDDDLSFAGTRENPVFSGKDRCYSIAVKKVENNNIDTPYQISGRPGYRQTEIVCLCRGPVPYGK